MSKIPGIHTAPDLPSPDDVVWAGEPITVLTCSGRPPDDHHNLCNREKCNAVTLKTEIAVDVFNEEAAWARAGVDPEAIMQQFADAFKLDAVLNSLLSLLYEAGVVTEDAVVEGMQKYMLMHMQQTRAVIEPQMRRARAQAGLALPTPSKLLGPNGQVLQ